MTTAEGLGIGGINKNGKPIFISTEHRAFAPSVERTLTDQEQLAWKSFQLWRATRSIERRDSVYSSIVNSDFTNFNLAYHIMGTPYPVIDNVTHVGDCLMGIRWYEHIFSAVVAYSYGFWIRSKASSHAAKLSYTTRRAFTFGTFFLLELSFCYRSMFRLAGFLPNDYECRRYGVLEDNERLEKKKEMWERYAAYKKEWCRRFDYHVYGIRPGENWNLFSACWIPAWEPSFGKVTHYPPRKNPYFLSSTPLSEKFAENPTLYEIPAKDNVPLVRARPELKYLYHGPINASTSTKDT